MEFRNSTFKKIIPYVPGEQPTNQDWIKLNTNEFPHPPSQKVLEVLENIMPDMLRKYPHPFAEPLRSHLAKFWKIDKEQLAVTNGSDEALLWVCRVFLDKDEKAVFSSVTYSLYKTLVEAVGKEFIETPCLNQKENPMAVDLFALEQSSAKFVFLPNPNAPTGEFFEPAKLSKIIQHSNKLWLIDEAYNDFVETPNSSFIPFLQELPNAIVTRTFSKSYGLAGMRLGYVVSANPKVMQGLLAAKDSYNVDALAVQVGKAALHDQAYFKQTVGAVIEQRNFMHQQLLVLGFFVIPSQANFLLVAPPEPFLGQQVFAYLRSQKILVRYFSSVALKNFVRITIGNKEENKIIINQLKNFIDKGKA